MANDYYTASADPADNSDGDPAIVRAEHALIAAGLDKLASLTANGDKLVTINSGATAQSARSLLGTANQITVTIAAGSITLSLPSVVTMPGTLAVTGALSANAGGIFKSFTAGFTGSAVEIGVAGGVGTIQCYDRTGVVYIGAVYDALTHTFNVSGVSKGQLTSTGLNACAIGASSPSTGAFTALRTGSATPATAVAIGTSGDISWDASYVYVCTAPNTWKRAPIATW